MALDDNIFVQDITAETVDKPSPQLVAAIKNAGGSLPLVIRPAATKLPILRVNRKGNNGRFGPDPLEPLTYRHSATVLQNLGAAAGYTTDDDLGE